MKQLEKHTVKIPWDDLTAEQLNTYVETYERWSDPGWKHSVIIFGAWLIIVVLFGAICAPLIVPRLRDDTEWTEWQTPISSVFWVTNAEKVDGKWSLLRSFNADRYSMNDSFTRPLLEELPAGIETDKIYPPPEPSVHGEPNVRPVTPQVPPVNPLKGEGDGILDIDDFEKNRTQEQ